MRLPFLVINVGRPTSSPPSPVVTEEKHFTKEEERVARERTRERILGPFEKVFIFEDGGETWITLILRRILEEHLDTNGRYLKVPIRYRRLIGMSIGIAGGLLAGAIAWIIMIIGQLFSPAMSLPMLALTILLGMGSGAFFPGWWLGSMIFKTPAHWYIRRKFNMKDDVPTTIVLPIVHDTYVGSKFKGEITIKKDSEGKTTFELPPGVSSSSAHAAYGINRAKALIKMWLTAHTQRMQKLMTGSLVVIAVCALLILFFVGFTFIRGGDQTVLPTPTQSGEVLHGK